MWVRNHVRGGSVHLTQVSQKAATKVPGGTTVHMKTPSRQKLFLCSLTWFLVVGKIQFLAVCWIKGPSSLQLLARGLPQVLNMWTPPWELITQLLTSLTREWTKEREQTRLNPRTTWNLTSELTSHHFFPHFICYKQITRSSSHSGRDYKRAWKPGGKDH